MADEAVETVDSVDAGDSGDSSIDTPDAQPEVDHEARSKELEAENTRLSQSNAQSEKLLETMANRSQSQQPAPVVQRDPQDFANVGEVEQLRSQVAQSEHRRIIDNTSRDFLDANPELKPHQKMLGQIVSFTDPSKPLNVRMEEGAKTLRDFIKTQQDEGAKSATQSAGDKKKAVAKASGLDSSRTQSPKTKDDKIPTAQEEVNARKARLVKAQFGGNP